MRAVELLRRQDPGLGRWKISQCGSAQRQVLPLQPRRSQEMAGPARWPSAGPRRSHRKPRSARRFKLTRMRDEGHFNLVGPPAPPVPVWKILMAVSLGDGRVLLPTGARGSSVRHQDLVGHPVTCQAGRHGDLSPPWSRSMTVSRRSPEELTSAGLREEPLHWRIDLVYSRTPPRSATSIQVPGAQRRYPTSSGIPKVSRNRFKRQSLW